MFQLVPRGLALLTHFHVRRPSCLLIHKLCNAIWVYNALRLAAVLMHVSAFAPTTQASALSGSCSRPLALGDEAKQVACWFECHTDT